MPSRFKRLEYPAVGASYRSPSLPASAQRTVNMYPEAIPDGLKSVVLHQFPGLSRQLSGVASEYDRGLHVFNNQLYQVAGGTLYKISSTFSRTAVGSIAGAGRVSMAHNSSLMVIVTGGDGEYTFDGVTLTATTLGQNPTSVSYLNSRFLFDDDDGRIAVSDVGLTSITPGNYFTPESNPDALVRTFVWNQFVYAFNEKSIEPWQNVTSGTPPFARMNGSIIERTGLAGQFAVDATDQAIYFVSDDGDAQQLQGFQPKQISSVAINNAWRDYTLSDAIVQTVRLLSLDFVIFMFPTDGKTWVYIEQYDLWFELEHGTDGARWKGNSIVEAYGKRVAADFETGNIYVLDPDVYTDNDDTVARERILRPLSGDSMGTPRQFYQMNEFGLSIETGVANSAEIEPLVAVSWSTDGGKSFSGEVFKQVGQEGEYLKDIRFNRNKHFKDLTVKIRYTEPTKFSIFAAYIEIRESGAK